MFDLEKIYEIIKNTDPIHKGKDILKCHRVFRGKRRIPGEQWKMYSVFLIWGDGWESLVVVKDGKII